MATYMQHKTGTTTQMVQKIVSLYAKFDALNANPNATKRQIGAASAQITKARFNHYEAINAQMFKANPNTERFERQDAATKEAQRQVQEALKEAGRETDKY